MSTCLVCDALTCIWNDLLLRPTWLLWNLDTNVFSLPPTVYERLPTELGWKRAAEAITIPDVERVVGTIQAAQSLLTEDEEEASTAGGKAA